MSSILKVDNIQNTSGTAALTIDSSGRVSKGTSGQLPAFLAHASGNWSTSSGQYNVGNDANLKFGVTHYNYGSHYSTTTGRFVVPVTGLYHFWNCMAMNSNSNTYTYMSAEVHEWASNGSTLTRRWIGGWGNKTSGSGVYDRHYYSVVLPLTAGDGISAGYEMSTANVPVLGGYNGVYSSFGGYLVG